MPEIEPIPEHFQKLIVEIRNHHESMGGEQRGALAEIQVRSILATKQAGENLKNATIGLRTATWVLVAVTLGLGLVTFFTRSQ